MGDRLDPEELRAYFAVRRVADRMQRGVTRRLRQHGLTEVQFSILAEIVLHGSRGMSDLAHTLAVSKSGLSYQAARLEELGLAGRDANDEDERGVVIYATAAGEAMLHEALPDHVSYIRQTLIGRLTRDEIRELTRILSRVDSALGE